MRRILDYFSLTELLLWTFSVIFIVLSFLLFDKMNYLTLIASLVGVTSLIFNAKGNPLGQLLMIVFSVMYGIISYSFSYFGEMITYLGMTAPMALLALISWLKNPYKGNRAEVSVNSVSKKEVVVMLVLAVVVTIVFYYILTVLKTANIIPSTISVTTSFIAAYLTARRSPFFALAYASNDVVLIVMWILAAVQNISYISVIICFIAFLVNDLYGYINWRRIEKKQRE